MNQLSSHGIRALAPLARPALLVLACVASMSAPALAQPFNASSCSPNCYVSPSGSDLNGHGTPQSPWATLAKCLCEVGPGASCLFLDGTYEAPQCSAKFSNGSDCDHHWGWWLDTSRDQQSVYHCTKRMSCGSSSGVVTVRSVNGADAVKFTQSNPAATCDEHMVVEGNCDYLKFQGITFASGRNKFGEGSSNITFRENIFKCPSSAEPGSTNSAVLMSGQNLVTTCDNWLVENNLFLMDSTCNATCTANGKRNFTKMYSQDNSVWQNNDYIVDPSFAHNVEWAAGFKGSNQSTTFRYNYVRSKKSGGIQQAIVFNTTGYGSNGNNKIYQNVVHNSQAAIDQRELNVRDDDFYNNTFYDVDVCYRNEHSSGDVHTGTEFFNNICVLRDPGDQGVAADDWLVGVGLIQQQSYFNNNIYYPKNGGTNVGYRNGLVDLPSLSTWQVYLLGSLGLTSSLNESASRNVNPQLASPANGDYSIPVTSPANSGGRGGSYPTKLGAFLTGTETIGCTFHPSCSSEGGSTGDDDDDGGGVPPLPPPDDLQRTDDLNGGGG